MSFLNDETGGKSSARLLLMVWTILSAAVVTRLIFWWPQEFPVEVVGVILTFLSGIELGLIGWAGGARIASYLMPQISSISGSISGKLKDGLNKFSSNKEIPSTETKETTEVDESTASTDISELSQKG
jgi:hypothetical protein